MAFQDFRQQICSKHRLLLSENWSQDLAASSDEAARRVTLDGLVSLFIFFKKQKKITFIYEWVGVYVPQCKY